MSDFTKYLKYKNKYKQLKDLQQNKNIAKLNGGDRDALINSLLKLQDTINITFNTIANAYDFSTKTVDTVARESASADTLKQHSYQPYFNGPISPQGPAQIAAENYANTAKNVADEVEKINKILEKLKNESEKKRNVIHTLLQHINNLMTPT